MTDAAMNSNVDIRKLDRGDLSVLDRVAVEVFDGPVDPHWARVFLDDPRHHLFVAVESGVVVGMVSAVDYVHPDKAPQLWINELGVGRNYRRRGIARRLLASMLAHGRDIGCTEAWLGIEHDNLPARRLYERQGCVPEPFVLYFFPLDSRPPA